MLRLNNLEVVYNDIILVLRGISLEVPEAGIIAFLGSNGAGKSTTLRAISGLLDYEDGEIKKGAIEFGGQAIHEMGPQEIVRLGITQVPEGRRIFGRLTVMENLEMGAFICNERKTINENLELVFTLFPRLKERRSQVGGTLSGGEQQMLATARALMANPQVLLIQ